MAKKLTAFQQWKKEQELWEKYKAVMAEKRVAEETKQQNEPNHRSDQ